MFNRILVGLDGSPTSWSAVHYAFEFGKRLDVPVVGIHVIDERILEEGFLEDIAGVLGFNYYAGISGKLREFFEEQASVLLDEFLALGRSKGVKVSSYQSTGKPYHVILAQADPEDLIMLGKKSHKPVSGFLLGSTTEVVARRSPCPVFVAVEQKKDIKKICVASDGSEPSKRALHMGKLLGKLFDGEVYAVHVGEGDLSAEVGEGVRYVRLSGIPEEKLVEYSKDMDLMLIGAFSKGRIKELFLGSVTTFVMHHANIPLLLVK
jgi:nucleotide-binding universal stress UspA family protein